MGSALAERTGEVIEAAASRAHREMEREGVPELERAIEEHFMRLGKLATVAVADWVAGEPVDMASAAGEEFSRVFAQLAASRDVPLGEVVRRCRCWRESCARWPQTAPRARRRCAVPASRSAGPPTAPSPR